MALVAGGYLAFTASRIKANALDQGIPAYYVDFLFFMMGLGVVIATYGGIKALMGDGITFAGKEKRDNLKKMQKKLQSKSALKAFPQKACSADLRQASWCAVVMWCT